jgi:hypothetical protein
MRLPRRLAQSQNPQPQRSLQFSNRLSAFDTKEPAGKPAHLEQEFTAKPAPAAGHESNPIRGSATSANRRSPAGSVSLGLLCAGLKWNFAA